jgi:hypothetical protein
MEKTVPALVEFEILPNEFRPVPAPA